LSWSEHLRRETSSNLNQRRGHSSSETTSCGLISMQPGIGIGRSLAIPPSHTTRHTGPYYGGSIGLHAVRCRQSDEAHLINEALVQGYPSPWGLADSPWPFATPRGRVRQEWGDPPLAQVRLPSPVSRPGLPWEVSETMTSPAVHLPHHRGRLAAATATLPGLPRPCRPIASRQSVFRVAQTNASMRQRSLKGSWRGAKSLAGEEEPQGRVSRWQAHNGQAEAGICVIRGCVFLLSLTATCQV
jgi:hypothetical protein